MKVAEVLKVFDGAIVDARERGLTYLTIEEVEEFAASLHALAAESPADVSAGEASLEAYRAKLGALTSSLQQEHETELELLKATISTGQSALQSATLINGGAAVALLAFLGAIWASKPSGEALGNFSMSLSFFVSGVLAAAVAAGATYLSQAGFGGEFGKYSQRLGRVGQVLAILFVLCSYVLFGLGAWSAYTSLAANNSSKPTPLRGAI